MLVIFQVEKSIYDNGHIERILHYRPLFNTSELASIECTIPEKNVEQANIRVPISVGEANDILKNLKKRTRIRNPIDTIEAKLRLKTNDIHLAVKVLKRFWGEKKRRSDGLTKTQKDIIKNALGMIVEELALVKGIKLDKAEEKIKLALEN